MCGVFLTQLPVDSGLGLLCLGVGVGSHAPKRGKETPLGGTGDDEARSWESMDGGEVLDACIVNQRAVVVHSAAVRTGPQYHL